MTRRAADAVRVGDELEPLVVEVDRERLVAYAAASGDYNRIHWDEQVARSVGLPGVIAHGMWTMGAAAELVARWVGDPTAVVAYRTKFTAPVVVPATGPVAIEARGVVRQVMLAEPGRPWALIALTVTCAGEQVLTRAQATVALAPGNDGRGGDGSRPDGDGSRRDA